MNIIIEENGIERKVETLSKNAAEAYVRNFIVDDGEKPTVAGCMAHAAVRLGRLLKLPQSKIMLHLED